MSTGCDGGHPGCSVCDAAEAEPHGATYDGGEGDPPSALAEPVGRATDTELAEVMQLDTLATPGPWRGCGDGCLCGIVWSGDDSGMVAKLPYPDEETGGPNADAAHRLANWRLIIAARNLTPRVAREVVALRSEVSLLRSATAPEKKAENPEEELSRHVANLRAALTFFEEWAEIEDYGAFHGGDPRMFTPDPNDSTIRELTAYNAACEAWERGDRTEHGRPSLNETEIRYRDKAGKETVVEPHTAFVSGSKFGPGSYKRIDAEMVRMRDALRTALGSKTTDDGQVAAPKGTMAAVRERGAREPLMVTVPTLLATVESQLPTIGCDGAFQSSEILNLTGVSLVLRCEKDAGHEPPCGPRERET